MKIAYVTESLLPHVDGVSRTLAQLFGFLEQQPGVDFRVLSPFTPPPEISWAGRVGHLPYVRFPLNRAYRVAVPIGHKVSARLDAYGPDLIHVVSPTPVAVRAQKYGLRRGIPVVSSFHTHFVSYFHFYRLGWLEGWGWNVLRRFYARCEVVYAPSHGIIRELARHGITNTELWSRGIDLARFSPRWRDAELRARVGADDRTPVLLMVSRLVKEKDLADLVAADRILRSRGARYRLVLVGDGPMRGELEKSLPDAHFAGHQTGEALARWYASGDVFVFPSTTETFGNVILEAQASGLPAVVVDSGGPPDLVEPGETGLIARANDPEDFAAKVLSLLEDPEARRRMGCRGREAAAEHDWSAINGRLLESYRRVLEGYRPRAAR
ncbi:glycosyltransferase family 1 protein [Longimicrobium sp.]|uniref:glycosyltransferase family 4 protein n=1 Tax=Longimicrobium sp. TaxID=2029185 RepID=UPI002BA8CDE8|nr:glycosyltransferase family 1 protein [Longimicrobium sp.]HSU17754.1 glycosyltransferase family 1 protein [Longimicrobium sp.]